MTAPTPLQSSSERRRGGDNRATFDDLSRNVVLPPFWRGTALALPDVPIDITEDDKAYRITAEIPGMDKGDIEVSVERNQVSIRVTSPGEPLPNCQHAGAHP